MKRAHEESNLGLQGRNLSFYPLNYAPRNEKRERECLFKVSETSFLMKKVIPMTLHKKWFEEILSGQKKVEYREKKDYWKKRLFDEGGTKKPFTHVRFKNGYHKDAPEMLVEIRDIIEKEKYEIHLGAIIGKKNIPSPPL